MNKIIGLILLTLSTQSLAIECKLITEYNSDMYSPSEIKTLKSICDLYADQIYNRYSRQPSIEFMALQDYGYAEFDKEGLNQPDMRLSGILPKSIASKALMLCHEIGHGIAGGKTSPITYQDLKDSYPDYSDSQIKVVLSRPAPYAEDEADYYAIGCMKNLLQNKILNQNKFVSSFKDVIELCSFEKNPQECEYILSAAKTSLFFGTDLKQERYLYNSKKIESLKPSASGEHPSEFCRLKIYREAYFNRPMPNCWIQ